MARIVYFILGSIGPLLAACTSRTEPVMEKAAPVAAIDTAATVADTLPEAPKPVLSAEEQVRQDTVNVLNAVIQARYPHLQVYTYRGGDIDADGRRDMIVVAETRCDSLTQRKSRTVFLLLNTGAGQLRIAAVNPHPLVMPVGCDGLYDSFSGISCKGSHFTFNSFDGTYQRTYYHVTFRYDRVRRDWFLYRRLRFDSDCRDVEAGDEIEETPRKFGRIRFSDYQGGEF